MPARWRVWPWPGLTLGLEQVIKRIPLKTIVGSTLGLFVGLGIGKLASYPFDKYL